jgi:hypothetical protein
MLLLHSNRILMRSFDLSNVRLVLCRHGIELGLPMRLNVQKIGMRILQRFLSEFVHHQC